MAIKDWELRKNEKKELIYVSINTGESLNLSKVERDEYSAKNFKPFWSVQNSNMFVNKGFSTKAEAVRFARKYMGRN